MCSEHLRLNYLAIIPVLIIGIAQPKRIKAIANFANLLRLIILKVFVLLAKHSTLKYPATFRLKRDFIETMTNLIAVCAPYHAPALDRRPMDYQPMDCPPIDCRKEEEIIFSSNF